MPGETFQLAGESEPFLSPGQALDSSRTFALIRRTDAHELGRLVVPGVIPDSRWREIDVEFSVPTAMVTAP